MGICLEAHDSTEKILWQSKSKWCFLNISKITSYFRQIISCQKWPAHGGRFHICCLCQGMSGMLCHLLTVYKGPWEGEDTHTSETSPCSPPEPSCLDNMCCSYYGNSCGYGCGKSYSCGFSPYYGCGYGTRYGCGYGSCCGCGYGSGYDSYGPVCYRRCYSSCC